MGSELASYQEWSHDRSLDWHLLEHEVHRGVQNLVRDLNALYRRTPALYEVDFDATGFEWIEWNDRDNSVLSWIRRDKSGGYVICITNFTPVVRYDYQIGVPEQGRFGEIMNTDSEEYAGSGIGNDVLSTSDNSSHGQPNSLRVTIPPLATLILQRTD